MSGSNKFYKIVVALLFQVIAIPSWAEISIIVHPSNKADIPSKDIKRIFLGVNRRYSDGAEAVPISYQLDTDLSKEFSNKVLDKSPHQLKAYWAKMLFSGKGTPPKVMDSVEHIVILVSNNPSLIGFVPSEAVNDSVRVVKRY